MKLPRNRMSEYFAELEQQQKQNATPFNTGDTIPQKGDNFESCTFLSGGDAYYRMDLPNDHFCISGQYYDEDGNKIEFIGDEDPEDWSKDSGLDE